MSRRSARRSGDHSGSRCRLCGQVVPIGEDGRCPLGHQVLAPQAAPESPAAAAEDVAAEEATPGAATADVGPPDVATAAAPAASPPGPARLPVFPEDIPPPALPLRSENEPLSEDAPLPSGPRPPESHPAESHPAESHPAESRPAESHAAESHAAESRPAESRPAESRPAESRPAERDAVTPGTLRTRPASDPRVEIRLDDPTPSRGPARSAASGVRADASPLDDILYGPEPDVPSALDLGGDAPAAPLRESPWTTGTPAAEELEDAAELHRAARERMLRIVGGTTLVLTLVGVALALALGL